MTVIAPTTTTRPTSAKRRFARLNRQVLVATGGTGSQWDYLYNAVVSHSPGLKPSGGTYFQFANPDLILLNNPQWKQI